MVVAVDLQYAVYLGAYDDEDAAAHAYDLAALKYWGQDTILNFPLLTYEEEFKEMELQSKEEYIGSLRRKSSGFSRGVSKYRGVARHHHNGRWEARIGRVFGNKYLYLGTYGTQEEAATAYDMAAIEYRGLKAVTNFDLSRYNNWIKRDENDNNTPNDPQQNHNPSKNIDIDQPSQNLDQELASSIMHPHHQPQNPSSLVDPTTITPQPRGATTSSALGLLLQSSKFKEMLERNSAIESSMELPHQEPEVARRRSFPDDIQTYFDSQDSSNIVEEHDSIFFDLNSFESPMFQYELGG
ncbi:hypothetical protein Leryth_011978 [Lithospermum erythrorhizon]|nr:hypothetical protein Leryth_011978 [Lithospermum erythrorhizon]